MYMKPLFALLCILTQPLFAALTVDGIYQPHMVLQQGQQVPVSGTCSGSEPVKVSFNGQHVTATRDGDRWQALLAPMTPQSKGQTLSITQGNETIELGDVLVGEVWLAAGQSNMLWRLEETRDKEALNHPSILLFRHYHSEPQVVHPPRVFTAEERQKLISGNLYQGSWSVSSPETSRRMSAVGWYFGKKLRESLRVPVGVINVSFGGSNMLAWTPHRVIEQKYPECLGDDWTKSKYVDGIWVPRRAELNLGNDRSTPHPYKPSYLFENGVRRWVNFPIAGIIWYQGESDAERQPSEQNTRALTDLITSWREEFKKPNLPFIMVQLPRIREPKNNNIFHAWPEFRAVQQSVSDQMPNVHCCVTIDLGSTDSDIHPRLKVDVGKRLANMAAALVYGRKDIPYSGPVVSAVKPKGDAVCLSFKHAKSLKTNDGKAPVGFEISADGKTYHPAVAEIRGQKVWLTSNEVKKPKYARYAWTVFIEPNLVNEAGLPLAPYAGN